ncbi:MAG: hypothetical protein J6Y47_04640 [Bacteroidales bacterium]|nr:hypothetical protein [Bacteroidales bacterium]
MMKKSFLTACLLLALCTMYAQSTAQKQKNTSVKPTTEADMLTMKLNVLKDVLLLSDEQFAKFKPIYEQYFEKVSAIKKNRCKCDKSGLTDAQIKDCLERSFDEVVNLATLKKQYISEFSKVLTMKQVEKLYSMEARMKYKVRDEMDHRTGERVPPVIMQENHKK